MAAGQATLARYRAVAAGSQAFVASTTRRPGLVDRLARTAIRAPDARIAPKMAYGGTERGGWTVAEFEVTESGSSVTVSVGDEIVVRVPEIPTTGYAWTITSVGGPLRLVESSYVPDGPAGPAGNGVAPAPGAGGKRLIRLRAASPGEAAAELALKRPWETEPTETFILHATVRG